MLLQGGIRSAVDTRWRNGLTPARRTYLYVPGNKTHAVTVGGGMRSGAAKLGTLNLLLVMSTLAVTASATASDVGELITERFGVIDVNGIVRYRNRVPEYPIAHLPDWLVTNASAR